MEKKIERDQNTHDFMKVDSFSQLPFTRSAPPVREKIGIRLFGINFDSDITVKDSPESGEPMTSPKFKCHYCCRNFPTSQALGGHQNAHKRERWHAKHAHLSMAMVHGSISDEHTYRLVNYRLGSEVMPTLAYPYWKNYSSTIASDNQFYGSHGSFSINGRSLASWRIPVVQNITQNFNRDGSLTPSLPLFSGNEMKPESITGYSSPNRHVYESKLSVQEHVSLDLHL